MPVWRKSPAGDGKKRGKDDDDAEGITRHDARLPRLRAQIEETRSEGGNPTLQIYTEESHTLIGRTAKRSKPSSFS